MCTRQTFCSPRSVAASLPGAQPPHLVNPHADLPAAPVPHLQPTGVRPSASGQPDRVGAGGLAVPRATNKSLSKTRHSGGPGWTPTTPLALTSGWSPGRKPVAGVCSATTPSSMKPPCYGSVDSRPQYRRPALHPAPHAPQPGQQVAATKIASATQPGNPRTASCLSFCLIHLRPAPFTSDRPGHVRAGRGLWRTVVNAGAHCWKACWGQPLAGSNPASSAATDQE